jgi:CHAD domain-containing protein
MARQAAAFVTETERKYEFPGSSSLGQAGGIVAEIVAARPEELRLSASYFDTADLALLRSGITLRRREGGDDAGWHLKLPVAADTREEVRLPLNEPGADRHHPPAELVELTRLPARGHELVEVALVETRRRRWPVRDAEGRPSAELVDDEVTAHTAGPTTTAVSWREVEVELAEHGDPEILDRIERDLVAAGAHRSRSSNKLGRVLAAEPRARPARLPEGSAGAEVLAYVRRQAERLRGLDPQVRRDAPDALHQMRVAARRLRSALQAYRGVLDRSDTDALIDELRWLGGELGAARDAEVIEAGLLADLQALPEHLVLGPVAAHITRVMQRRRAEGYAHALTVLNGDRYLRLHDALDRLVADPPLRPGGRRPGEAGREALRKAVTGAWKRTRSRLIPALEADAGDDRDRELHEARKSAKRLRYALEVAEPALGGPARRLRKELETVHSVLGDHQDAVVARPVLRELAAQAHLDDVDGFTFGVLYGVQLRRAEQAERVMAERWRSLRRSDAVRELSRGKR